MKLSKNKRGKSQGRPARKETLKAFENSRQMDSDEEDQIDDQDSDDSMVVKPKVELLVTRKASTFCRDDLNPSLYPYDYIQKKTQVRTLLNTHNRQRWQQLIQQDLISPGFVAQESDAHSNQATDLRYDSKYRDCQKTMNLEKQSLGRKNVNNYIGGAATSTSAGKGRHANYGTALNTVEYADKRVVRLKDRINQYAKKKQKMWERAVTVAQMAEAMPASSKTVALHSYAAALAPGLRSLRVTPNAQHRMVDTAAFKSERTTHKMNVHIQMFGDSRDNRSQDVGGKSQATAVSDLTGGQHHTQQHQAMNLSGMPHNMRADAMLRTANNDDLFNQRNK